MAGGRSRGPSVRWVGSIRIGSPITRPILRVLETRTGCSILEEFKNGTRNEAVFWMDMHPRSGGEYAPNGGPAEGKRKILIRYFPVRGKDGEYLGCLEATQEITDILKIEGEKRLLG